ncbi:MAG: hypothetical protein K2J10_06300, partial [Muribaculaceae bacterium]|nr:hypothetical protein [Muribaculaceae bacterium]
MKELKKFFNRLFVLSLVLIICISCNTDEPQESQDTIDSPTVDNPEDKIEYYVKYESYVSIPSSKYITIAITVETEKGRQSLNVPRTWEGVFGPFNELTTLYVASNTG